MSIEIEGLSKHFFEKNVKKQVLSGLSLQVRPGSIFALAGANGAGKTTLLKIIATLIAPDAGRVLAGGIDTAVDPDGARRKLSLVTDTDRSFYQMLSVRENLSFYARLFDVPRAAFNDRIGELGRHLDLTPWLDVKLGHCSSGIRQRIAVARALLTDPQVLLIDELTRSLDEGSRDMITAYLRKIVPDRSIACLVVSHDREWSGRFADATGNLKDGRIATE